MISLEDAQQFVFGLCTPLPERVIPLDEALACVVSTAVVATEPIPPFANSSMDGFAVRAQDTRGAPVSLAVIGCVMAGHVFANTVGPGQAVRIMTGAPIPRGADAVCMIEDTETGSDAGTVTIGREIELGAFVRQLGSDVSVGDVLAPVGTMLTPAHLGVLASQGASSVLGRPHPRVGVLSTGDELFSGAGPLPAGQIRDANRQTLLAMTRREGWEALDLGVVEDDQAALAEVLTDAARTCDVVITSGGVSVGDLDLVRVVLEKLGAGTMRWMQVGIKPAKPFAFGLLTASGTPVFGLPGNPVSAMVSFEMFVRPAVRLLGGHRTLHRPVVAATADVDIVRPADGKLHLLRAQVTLDRQRTWHVTTTNGQESHQLHSMAESNALVLLPDGTGARAGELVDVLLIDVDQLADVPSGPLAGCQHQESSS